MAYVEGHEMTWVNFYNPFIEHYSATGGPLTLEEVTTELNMVWLYFSGVYWALTTIATVGWPSAIDLSFGWGGAGTAG